MSNFKNSIVYSSFARWQLLPLQPSSIRALATPPHYEPLAATAQFMFPHLLAWSLHPPVPAFLEPPPDSNIGGPSHRYWGCCAVPSFVISRPWSRDSSALEFILSRSRSWSQDSMLGAYACSTITVISKSTFKPALSPIGSG